MKMRIILYTDYAYDRLSLDLFLIAECVIQSLFIFILPLAVQET